MTESATEKQQPRTGHLSIYDTKLSVREEPDNGGRCGLPKGYDDDFRKTVFKRIIQQLNRLGYNMRQDEEHDKQYACLSRYHRIGNKGELQCYLNQSGRHIELEFYQDVYNIDREDGQGRYCFNKFERMPYLMRLEFQRTVNRLTKYLQNVFGYPLKEKTGKSAKCGPGALTAYEWIKQDWESCWHYSPEVGHRPISSDDNRKTADGHWLEHGQRCYTTDYSGRVITGIAYYNINNMWWVVTGKYDYENKASFEIYAVAPENIRQKRNERKRRRKLEALLSSAVNRMDYLKAHQIKRILFGDDPLFYIKKDNLYYGPNNSGYTDNKVDAGKYRESEIPKFPESRGLKIIPVG